MSETVLQEAERIINGQRREDYGSVSESFNLIAGMWSAYLGKELSGHDVANLMVLLKIARAKNGYHRDSYVDIAGYAGCTEKLEQEAAKLGELTPEKTGATREPRVWPTLGPVNYGTKVTDRIGRHWEARDQVWGFYRPSGEWQGIEFLNSHRYKGYGPFTEVLGEDG
ncbi:DUF6378 domain-containing protein [Mycobacterium avium]|uniref:DUF6378 domain-containing protein n=1 Tax=Mycobacterium avium TaxID=1764 RepID=UPI0015E22522|nr:DUF6378 domain-containing protein [Mycobacterium avium]